MKRIILCALALFTTLAGSTAGAIPLLDFRPVASAVEVGDAAAVEVWASGLEGELIGAYDLTLLWDASLLSLSSVAFSGSLDGPSNSIQEYTAAVGTLNAFEVSLGALASQTGFAPFSLFTLTFDTLAIGNANVGFSGSVMQILGDELGVAYSSITLSMTSIGITDRVGPPVSVPEPSAWVLALAGLIAMLTARRRAAARASV